MKRIALKLAIFTFFVMALTGMCSGQPPSVVAMRSVLGAVVGYVAGLMAVRLALDVMIKSVVETTPTPKPTNEDEEERATEE